MSNYMFLPAPDVQGGEESYAWWDNSFSKEDLRRICEIGDRQISASDANDALVGDNVLDPNIRRSKITWMGQNDAGWLYDRMGYIARMVNAQYFQFDLYGFSEDFQYTVYEGNPDGQGHYGKHIDKGFKSGDGTPPRKLSMVLQLSDPDDYEGGDLQLHYGNGVKTVDKKQGVVHVFPSWVVHEVTPVTKGIRKSLVVWVSGPKFR